MILAHIGMRHAIEDNLLWRNDSSTTCTNGDVVGYMLQTGSRNVDLSNFGNGFRYVDNATSAGVNCSTTTYSFNNNYIAYCGDHGWCFNLQNPAQPVVIAYNNIGLPNHRGINDVGGGAENSCQGCRITLITSTTESLISTTRSTAVLLLA